MANRSTRSESEEARCRNCGGLTGPRFCAHCGQEIEERRGPLLTVLREVLSDLLSFDSRLLRSLRSLCVPGRLTRLHLDGKRMPYVRPFHLYLLASLVLFSTVLTLDWLDATRYDIYVAGELISKQSAGENRSELDFLIPGTAIANWVVTHEGDKLERLRALPPQEILDLFFSAMRRILPAALIFFVPFLALAIKLLYLRTGPSTSTIWCSRSTSRALSSSRSGPSGCWRSSWGSRCQSRRSPASSSVSACSPSTSTWRCAGSTARAGG